MVCAMITMIGGGLRESIDGFKSREDELLKSTESLRARSDDLQAREDGISHTQVSLIKKFLAPGILIGTVATLIANASPFALIPTMAMVVGFVGVGFTCACIMQKLSKERAKVMKEYEGTQASLHEVQNRLEASRMALAASASGGQGGDEIVEEGEFVVINGVRIEVRD